MFCCELLCVRSGFAVVLVGKAGAGCFAWFVFLVSRCCCVALPHAPWVCLRFVIVVFSDDTHYFLSVWLFNKVVVISNGWT